jgi:phenylacetate-CoA ligase
MGIGEFIRNKLFALTDSLRKESIQKFVSELNNYEANGYDYITPKTKLESFLTSVKNSSSFYKDRNLGLELNKYPVISKAFLMNNAELFQSVLHSRKKLVRVSTSGSYGTPFAFYLTAQKKSRQKAESIYHGRITGYQVGTRHSYFRTVLPKSSLKLFLQNETFICCKVLGEDFLIEARMLIKERKLKILIGFPSAIAMVAQFCIDKGDNPCEFAVEGVITFAENLTNHQRDIITQAFGCKVHSRYGTEELGILGIQTDNESGFKLNTCNYIVEVLKLNEDITVSRGEMGRVVVTDLHSDAFPLIRYDTGDLAVLGDVFEENNAWAKTFEKLSGRIIQSLNATNGEKLYPLYFENVIEKLDCIIQYQLIQESEREYILKLVPKHSFDPQIFSPKELIDDMLSWLGPDAQIDLQIVKDIEMLPSGKRPSIINKLARSK